MFNDRSRSKPGRPRFDVSEQVFAYVSHRLAQGLSLSEACRDGLIVADAQGNMRKLRGNYLEEIYRKAERQRLLPQDRPTSGYKLGPLLFMGRPLPVPFGAALPSKRNSGRPKKIRSR